MTAKELMKIIKEEIHLVEVLRKDLMNLEKEREKND